MKLSSVFFSIVYIVVSAQVSLAAATADAIYHNGTILTINDAAPTAQAVAVKDGKILAVGQEAEGNLEQRLAETVNAYRQTR